MVMSYFQKDMERYHIVRVAFEMYDISAKYKMYRQTYAFRRILSVLEL